MLFSKTLVLATLLLSALAAGQAQACDENAKTEPGSFQGNLDVLLPVLNNEAHMACEQNETFQRVKLEVFAIYRCIGSPVRAAVKFSEGKSLKVFNMSVSGGNLTMHGENGEHLRCRIEALSSEEQAALDKKKADEKQAQEKAKREREKRLADSIAQFSPTALQNLERAIRAKLEAMGYELQTYKITSADPEEAYRAIFFSVEGTKKENGELAAGRGRALFEEDSVTDLAIY